MCTWVEMEVSWGRCSVLCRMYERGKEVVRQLLSQPGLSRAPSWFFTLFHCWLLSSHSLHQERAHTRMCKGDID